MAGRDENLDIDKEMRRKSEQAWLNAIAIGGFYGASVAVLALPAAACILCPPLGFVVLKSGLAKAVAGAVFKTGEAIDNTLSPWRIRDR